jgi:cytochrome P450
MDRLAFEDSDHDLFVELGRLGQVCRSTEIVDGKDVGPGLRRAGDELGSVNGLLRHPDTLARVRKDPTLAPAVFEEVVRLESPAQFFDDRQALADIPIADTVIPQGSRVTLVLAAANRDPRRFPHPDTFDIDRTDNQHLGFGGGLHYCFGAPLARLEGRIMIREWVRRVENPRLCIDPPPYGPNPRLRGPHRLLVNYDRIAA